MVAGLASLGAHLALGALTAALLLVRAWLGGDVPITPPIPSAPGATLELPVMFEGVSPATSARRDAVGTPPPRGGGEHPARLDSPVAGRGGDDEASRRAINLADRDDGVVLETGALTRLDRGQLQRIKSARSRSSREDWRASRAPTELTFLAMGQAPEPSRPERLTPAQTDPSRGLASAASPSRLGDEALGAAGSPEDAAAGPLTGGATLGAETASPGVGVRDGAEGRDHRRSASVAHARPMAALGTPSVPADRRDRPRDTVDSEQEMASAIASIVHASGSGGRLGAGRGGERAPGAPGAGGESGPGSRSAAAGAGLGPGQDRDQKRIDYLRRVMARIRPLWERSFPRAAALDGRQGTAIVSFTIDASGAVTSAAVTRRSGVPEYDARCREAVLRAAPFPPLPPELGPTLRWQMPFEMRNPAVRPRETSHPDPP